MLCELHLPMPDPIARTNPALLAVARGDEPAELCITNARVLNVFTRSIDSAAISIVGGRIAAVGEPRDAKTFFDAQGMILVPGLIDSHMHVESTMLLPRHFAHLALPHGTTAAVLDPHEIANVLGLPGVNMLMDDADDAPLHALWMAPSCVPASHLETSGATLSADDIATLIADRRVLGLAEMMNFPGVVHADEAVLAKIALGLEAGLVDGHSPDLMGKFLDAYAAAGIMTDHECTSAEQARARIARGMRIAIRQGSAARNLEALLPAISPETLSRFMFCTDDRHPGDLATQGHIDHIIRRAIALGLDPVDAIVIATINAAEHYRQHDLGALVPGRIADIVAVPSLESFVPELVFFQGQLRARQGAMIADDTNDSSSIVTAFPVFESARHSVHLPDDFDARSLCIMCQNREGTHTTDSPPTIRVIGMQPGQLITKHLTMPASVEDGQLVADPSRDLAKLVVIERHHNTGNIGKGFITGFGLARGALASTIGHDSHNLAVVGTNDGDMALAASALAECQGGQAVVADGKVLAVLPLPIAGLISDQPPPVVIKSQHALLEAARLLGCPMDDPFMPLSFMPLVVIPSLKLSDQGLVDVDTFEIVPLELC